jgi:hypothetical protein
MRQLLPTILRKKVLVAFLDAIASPLLSLYSKFMHNRNTNNYGLGITSQVCYLEKMLNDRYDPELRRIYITDGEFRDSIYLYRDVEQMDEYLFLPSENRDKYLYHDSELGFAGSAFIVYIPAELVNSMQEMGILTDSYKLAGRSFTITVIQ